MQFKYEGQSRKSGVYRITNIVNGKVYIGSAKEFKRRSKEHLRSLEKGVHQNKHLQAAFNNDGTDAFVFDVLEVVLGDQAARFQVEQTYLDQYLEDWTRCYNFKKKTVAKPRSCYSKTPEETRRKMSERMSGENNPMYGKSGELSPMYGHKASDEERKRRSVSAKKRGNNRPGYKHSEATKQKIRLVHLGKKLSEDHKRKLSESHKGHLHSEETKQKMRDAHKKRRDK